MFRKKPRVIRYDPRSVVPPLPPLRLRDADRKVLEHRLRSPATSQAMAMRSWIVLLAAEGGRNVDIAEELGVTPATVGKWRDRFEREGLAGLEDRPRSGAPRRITDGQIQRVIALARKDPPRGHDRWTTRSMAKRTGLSQSTVARIWRAHGIHPHRQDPTPGTEPS